MKTPDSTAMPLAVMAYQWVEITLDGSVTRLRTLAAGAQQAPAAKIRNLVTKPSRVISTHW